MTTSRLRIPHVLATTDRPDRLVRSRRIALRLFRGLALMGAVTAGTFGLAGCSRLSDILDVQPPAGQQTSDALKNRSGAEGAFNVAKTFLVQALVGSGDQLVELGGLMTDEFTNASLSLSTFAANIDARATAASSGYSETSDQPLSILLQARSALLLAERGLQQYELSDEQRKAGEAYALIGYAELFLAEDYCAGVPLSRALPDGGYEYGTPLTTDSMFATAEAHFDSALAHANGDSVVQSLAHIGLGRARLGRGNFTGAAAAVADVATAFVYNADTPPTYTARTNTNLYQYGLAICSGINVGDREGTNGINFISANDPRLVLSTIAGHTCDYQYGEVTTSVWYYPVKFGNPSTLVPIATGVEARLIEAEAALGQHQVTTWRDVLNALRQAAPTTYLNLASPMPNLAADSTTEASTTMQVDVMFRERAFWLFGTGTRLGDLRRLIRVYGRAANTVYPIGTYMTGTIPRLATYGTDVSFTLPTAASGSTTTNPNFVGCLTSTSTS